MRTPHDLTPTEREQLCEFTRAHGISPDDVLEEVDYDPHTEHVYFHRILRDEDGKPVLDDDGEPVTKTVIVDRAAPWPLDR